METTTKKKMYGYQITSRKILKPLIIRKIQIKATMVFHCTLFRMARGKKKGPPLLVARILCRDMHALTATFHRNYKS